MSERFVYAVDKKLVNDEEYITHLERMISFAKSEIEKSKKSFIRKEKKLTDQIARITSKIDKIKNSGEKSE